MSYPAVCYHQALQMQIVYVQQYHFRIAVLVTTYYLPRIVTILQKKWHILFSKCELNEVWNSSEDMMYRVNVWELITQEAHFLAHKPKYFSNGLERRKIPFSEVKVLSQNILRSE